MKSCLIIKLLMVFVLLILTNIGLTSSVFAQTDNPPELLPTPVGQVVKLDFIIPGVGSGSANFEPIHKTRKITLDFYDPDANSMTASIRPLASIGTQAVFDSDSASPTYGKFVNKNIDLGKEVPSGKYQISFKEERSLAHLVKDKEDAVGGKLFEVKNTSGLQIELSNQTVIVGDIFPISAGDNIIDIKDYNALVGCFGIKSDSASCLDKTTADLDDNGVVDGTDYNIMFSSFRKLLQMGLPVPSLFANPTRQVAKPTSKPAKRSDTSLKKPAKNGSIIPVIILIIILTGSGAGVFFFLKKRKQKNSEENPEATATTSPETNNLTAAKEETIDKEFYVKKQTDDPANKRTVLTLTDDDGPTLGYYTGKEVKEGFANVKGVKKIDGNKVYIDVASITPEEQAAS